MARKARADHNSLPWKEYEDHIIELVRRHIRRRLKRKPPPEGLAQEDIEHDIMVKIQQGWSGLRNINALWTWIGRIVDTTVADAIKELLRKRERETSLDELQEQVEDHTPFEPPEPRSLEDECLTREKLREYLQEIPKFLAGRSKRTRKRDAGILDALIMQQRSPGEVAKELGVSRQVVDMVIFALRKYVRTKKDNEEALEALEGFFAGHPLDVRKRDAEILRLVVVKRYPPNKIAQILAIEYAVVNSVISAAEKYMRRHPQKLYEILNALEKFLANRPQRDTEIVSMAIFEQRTCKEIAQRFGVECKSIDIVVSAAREFVRNYPHNR